MLKVEKNDPLHIQVYEIMKNAILDGDWKPGDKLVESKIATKLNLSRSPIREAFRILEYEGLLIKKDQNIYVHKPSLEDIIELYQMRYGLEALSCYLAAAKATDKELEEIKEILCHTKDALKNQNYQEIYEWNTRFHESIIHASKNNHLIFTMNGLRGKVHYCRNVLIRHDYIRIDNFFQEHFRIYQAISERRRTDAKALMEDHIRVDLNRILALFPEKNIEGGL